jgi:hypothetical protein
VDLEVIADLKRPAIFGGVDAILPTRGRSADSADL